MSNHHGPDHAAYLRWWRRRRAMRHWVPGLRLRGGCLTCGLHLGCGGAFCAPIDRRPVVRRDQ